MAYRQRGEGSFTHLVPQDCRTCKKSKNCKLKNLAGSHCSMRDRVERWVYQYYVRDIANKPVRKSISAKTRKLLLDKVDKLREKPQETVGTLGAWLDVWLEKVIKGSVKTSTYAYYKYMLKYVPEDVRQKTLKSLTLELFADLFQKLYATGSLKDGSALSTTTVRGVRNTLKSCLEVAVKQNLIPFNPVRETRPLRSITKDIVVLSKEEAKRLQSVADNVLYRTNSRRKDKGEAYLVRQWAVLIRLLLATGVRRSEAFGLQWENVDFQNRNIRICKSLYKGTLSDVKTSYSVRTINVDVKTMNRLRVWYHEQSAYASLLGDKFTNDYAPLESLKWDAVLICRSDIWSPPHLDDEFTKIFMPYIQSTYSFVMDADIWQSRYPAIRKLADEIIEYPPEYSEKQRKECDDLKEVYLQHRKQVMDMIYRNKEKEKEIRKSHPELFK